MLEELASDLQETSCELARCMSGGDYVRALQCRQKLGEISQLAVRLASNNNCPDLELEAYRTALTKANETLRQVRIKARVERDRLGRAMRHCGSVKSWMQANRNTF